MQATSIVIWVLYNRPHCGAHLSNHDFTHMKPLAPRSIPYRLCVVLMQRKDEGNVAFRQGNWAKAYKLYSQALNEDPTLVTARANRAACSINLQQWEDALNDCNLCLSGSESNKVLLTKVLWRRCVSLRKLGIDKMEWQKTIDRALALDPTNSTLLGESKYIFVNASVPEVYCDSKSKSRESPTVGLSAKHEQSPPGFLPSLPLTYQGVLKLLRNKSPKCWDFWYTNISKDELRNALSVSGVEPDVLDYIHTMIIANPQHQTKNKEFIQVLKELPRFQTALLMADQHLHTKAMESLQ